MTKKRHPYEMTDEEADFYRRIGNGPITVLRGPTGPRQKDQTPKQEEEPHS